MTTHTRKGEPDTLDPDYSAVFVALSMILNRTKPKKRAKLMRTIHIVARLGVAPGVSPTDTRARASACLNTAVKRLCETYSVALPED